MRERFNQSLYKDYITKSGKGRDGATGDKRGGDGSGSFANSFIDISSVDYAEDSDLLAGYFIDHAIVPDTEFPETFERLSKRLAILVGRCSEALFYRPLDTGLALCVQERNVD